VKHPEQEAPSQAYPQALALPKRCRKVVRDDVEIRDSDAASDHLVERGAMER
jgi:hypothetical protein